MPFGKVIYFYTVHRQLATENLATDNWATDNRATDNWVTPTGQLDLGNW